MIQTKSYRLTELVLFFVALPLSFLIAYPIYIKAGLVGFGFIYILVVLFKYTDTSIKVKKDVDWKSFWKATLLKLLVIALVTIAFIWFKAPENLFFVPLNKPGLYLLILGVYTFLSVWPQEIIYRTFFFKRYSEFFENKKVMVLINAIIFSLAHIFFKNILVLVLTFLGGLLFGYTFYKTKSTTLVSIEHAIYGNWLFTVGMGDMLAFPGMDN